MPHKFETTKLLIPEKLDKRRKLDRWDKEEIKNLYGKISQRKLAKQFNVSRSTIVFLGDEEAHKENLKRREERGGWKNYYDVSKHKVQMKKYRNRKYKLYKEGKLSFVFGRNFLK